MTKTIDLSQQPTLAELLALTAQGNEVVLVNAGKPVATLSPAEQPSLLKPTRRTPGLLPQAFLHVSDDFDDPLPDEFWFPGEK